jgi:multiple sugar transport system ATP-binding protein
MNMIEAGVERRNGSLVALLGSQTLELGGELLGRRPALERYEGKKIVLGVRPEGLEDAALEPDTPDEQRIKGVLVLREPLGSEIVAHFEVDAPPALTEDVRELARDVGQESTVQPPASEPSKTVMVGRFGPRSRARTGDVVDVAVDMSTLHAFDLDTGLGIYGQM